jgi:hypothetical protein
MNKSKKNLNKDMATLDLHSFALQYAQAETQEERDKISALAKQAIADFIEHEDNTIQINSIREVYRQMHIGLDWIQAEIQKNVKETA